jgi:hypothetical protein
VQKKESSPARLWVLLLLALSAFPLTVFVSSVAACGKSASASDAGGDVPQVSHEAGGPELESFKVRSAAGNTGIVLTPAFSPDIFDYYVRCAAGSNPLAVEAAAGKGATVAIDLSAVAFNQPMHPESGFEASQSLSSLVVAEGQAIVAVVRKGSETTQYWVRCLPSDMPTWTWGALPENGTLPASYFLIGDLYPYVGPTRTAYALVLDQNGVPVWYEPASPEGYGAGGVDSPVEDSVSFLNFFNEGIGPFTIFNLSSWTTTVLPTSLVWNREEVNLHELKYYPKTGNYLILGQPYTYGVDLSGIEIGGAGTEGTTNGVITDCAILEIKPSDGSVVNSWLASKHFDTKQVSTMPYENGMAPDGGLAVDVYHCNSIDIDPENGDLLISARNTNSVFYMTWPEGEILWKMGGINQSNNNAPYVAVDSPFAGQHDARLHNWNQSCNGGAGQVSIFDDETGGTLTTSRAVIYDVIVGKGDSKCADAGHPGKATVSWQYPGIGNASFSGSVRPLLGGKHPIWVIGWGVGTSPYAFSVIDQVTNDDLLDFYYTDNEPSYRVVPVPPDELNLTLLRETAGLPIP